MFLCDDEVDTGVAVAAVVLPVEVGEGGDVEGVQGVHLLGGGALHLGAGGGEEGRVEKEERWREKVGRRDGGRRRRNLMDMNWGPNHHMDGSPVRDYTKGVLEDASP